VTTLTKLKTVAKSVGATVEQDYPGCVQVVAPVGKWWFESGGPHLRVDWVNGGGYPDASLKREVIIDAIERIRGGYVDEPIDA
jgi:hypothetical protein